MSLQFSLFAPAAPSIEGINVAEVHASYSADRIAECGSVREPAWANGERWICVGGAWGGPNACFDLYRIVDLEDFQGEPTTYRAKTADCESARADPLGFYHGITVMRGGAHYVLQGPEMVLLAPRAEVDLDGIADDSEDRDKCRSCGGDIPHGHGLCDECDLEELEELEDEE